VDQLSTAMHGSGENHMCYFYKRLEIPPTPKTLTAGSGACVIEIPARPGREWEGSQRVVCANMFKSAVVDAVNDLDVLRASAAATVRSFLDSSRPARTRRQRDISYPGEK